MARADDTDVSEQEGSNPRGPTDGDGDGARDEPFEDATSDISPSVVIRDLHVKFRVFEEQRLSMHELIRRRFRSRRVSYVHALRGVDVTFHHGEAVGVVGSNGSGKSTLLRTIAGLERVEHGSVRVSAQAQFLGVGAALEPQLSGHRNIMIGGLAMGLTRDEIESRMDDVIEFSGLGMAVERPLRTYSSGMRSRLAFSIATMRSPEILLIDEALAVGDRAFRRRGLDRISQLKAEANTIVMVTHNHFEIRKTCDRTVWLDDGIIRADGATDDVLSEYESSLGDDGDDGADENDDDTNRPPRRAAKKAPAKKQPAKKAAAKRAAAKTPASRKQAPRARQAAPQGQAPAANTSNPDRPIEESAVTSSSDDDSRGV